MTSPPITPGDSPQWIGHVLDGRYKIRELLGEGGMGAVYTAEHLSLRKQVAVKVIRAEFAGNEEIAERFTREAMATAQIDHPNVASALDYGTLPDGGAYLVTQLVRGRSLESHRSAGVMPWRQACEIGAQIADALAAAHAINIVHRDLKPDNILLEPRDDGFLAKVLDFGVARVTSLAGLPTTELTRMGSVIGTPGYMAPEQAMGEKIDYSVDIYALGVILWECMAGRILWDGATVSDLFTAQLAGPAPPLATVVPGVPPELSALVDLMLDRNPKRRPESARQIRDALRRMSHGTLVMGQSPAVRPPVAPAPVSPRALLYAGGGLLALVLIAAMVALFAGDAPADAKTDAPGSAVPKDSSSEGKAPAAEPVPEAI
ncbi:MAG: serine/threonine protein kinase, partial [Myxococcales bacterium]|nr:serine/threonine protein kinase [Myxococcales bacterium]